MEVSVLIEPVAGNGYRASAASPFAFAAEGATREEALRKLKELMEGKISGGAELVRLVIGAPEPPWAKYAGTWRPDDPRIEEWKKAVEEYRRQLDEDTNVP
jgi:predicted RNase H-like HicB family nuclease